MARLEDWRQYNVEYVVIVFISFKQESFTLSVLAFDRSQNLFPARDIDSESLCQIGGLFGQFINKLLTLRPTACAME